MDNSNLRENAIVREMFAEIEKLKQTNPEYFAFFEDADPDTATRAELVDLMASAPNDLVKYFILGKFTMRMTIASVTGREFQ